MAGWPAALRRLLAAVALLGTATSAWALWAGVAYADHETRFKGQGGAVVDVGLIAWTVVGALLGLAALFALTLWWERRDEAAARRAQEEAGQEEGTA